MFRAPTDRSSHLVRWTLRPDTARGRQRNSAARCSQVKQSSFFAPNLLKRNFSAIAPDHVWVADTTYLPVIGGFLFLVAIIDLFSRKVVGWALGDHHDAELSCEALRRALARRSPRPSLIFHSDRGSEFAAANFRRLLEKVQAVQSMSRKGDGPVPLDVEFGEGAFLAAR
jgi:transposase InsO family protein